MIITLTSLSKLSMEKLQKLCLSCTFLLMMFSSFAQNDSILKARTEKYISKRYWHQFSYNSPEWQIYLDSALAIEPKNANLWQQKSMPNFKSGKYYDGMRFLNKAVEYDTLGYLGYRGFMKCIFMKDYANTIIDLKAIYKKRPIDQTMDHSYPFWIGVSYLKLNKLDSADYYLGLSVNNALWMFEKSTWLRMEEAFGTRYKCNTLKKDDFKNGSK